jgi:outer membrane lipoprotein-sorting protein
MVRSFESGRRRAAWLVPVAVVAAVGVGAAIESSGASAAPRLSPRTPAQLLTTIAKTTTTALSGKITEATSLGLPELPGAANTASLSWQSFLTGSHSVRVWVDGAAKQRLAVIGELSEADVVHNGRDVWTYTSDSNSVSHRVLPAHARKSDPMEQTHAELTPAAATARVLKAIAPTTSVTLGPTQMVADRAAYTLVISPRDARSTIRKITIAVDSTHFVPLQVEVFGASSTPAIKVGFTDISFATPSASTFNFHAPAGATVSKNPFTAGPSSHDGEQAAPAPMQGHAGNLHPRVIGSGWTSVIEVHGADQLMGASGPISQLTTQVGTSGMRLFHTALVNAVLLPDGRAFVGAVRPAALEHIAATTAH